MPFDDSFHNCQADACPRDLASVQAFKCTENALRVGLIEPLPAEDRRRPYRLTPAGATFHKAELARLARLVRTGEQKWGLAS